MPIFLPKSCPDIGIQILAMKQIFPSLKYYRNCNVSYWQGELGTSNSGKYANLYQVKIIYKYKKSPKVFIISPAIHQDAPHRYPDGSLCLHYPKDRDWKYNSIIAKTIVPWACEWFYFYEAWQEYGVWYADEVPHEKRKIQE